MTDHKQIEILLIDDSAEDVELALHALKRAHLANSIRTFSNAENALAYLNGLAEPLENSILILLDLNMPGMGGLNFLRDIRAQEKTRDIPVALLTSSTELPDIKESMKLGVCYIAKPIEFDDIASIASDLGFSLALIKMNNQ